MDVHLWDQDSLDEHIPLVMWCDYCTDVILYSVWLNTKRRPRYLKIQFVPRSKHFSFRL